MLRLFLRFAMILTIFFLGVPVDACETNNGGCPSDEICEMLDSSSVKCMKDHTGNWFFENFEWLFTIKDTVWNTNLENCWGICGGKGGTCNVEGCNGFCCSSSLEGDNGDCPASAIQFLLDHEDHHSSGHKCVEPKGWVKKFWPWVL